LILLDPAGQARSRLLVSGWLVLPISLYVGVLLRVSLFLGRYLIVVLPAWESGYFDYCNPALYRAVAIPPVDWLGLAAATDVTSQSLARADGILWLVSVEPDFVDCQRLRRQDRSNRREANAGHNRKVSPS
jgi:hypothetical protein